MMTKATTDALAADVILAYVPLVTPEGDGVVVRELSNGEWAVEGGDTFGRYKKSDAIAQAMRIAEEKWCS